MKVGIALLALGFPLLTPAVSAAATGQCLQHAMTTPAGLSSAYPSAVAPAGRFVVGDGTRADGQDSVVRWHDGVPAEIGVVGDEAVAADVSDDGQLVIGTVDGGVRKNLRYRDGKLEELPTPAGFASARATDIDNAHGLIAGTAYDADGWNARGVVWDATDQPRVLPIPAGFNEVRVDDIDDDGTVVGSVADWDYDNATIRSQRAAYWSPDGTVTVLPDTNYPEATAVLDGVAVGINGGTAVKWQLDAGTAGTPFATGHPIALNSRGTVLLANSTYQPGQGERTLEMKDTGGATGISAVGLTATNQVYGTDNYTHQPVRWDCS